MLVKFRCVLLNWLISFIFSVLLSRCDSRYIDMCSFSCFVFVSCRYMLNLCCVIW